MSEKKSRSARWYAGLTPEQIEKERERRRNYMREYRKDNKAPRTTRQKAAALSDARRYAFRIFYLSHSKEYDDTIEAMKAIAREQVINDPKYADLQGSRLSTRIFNVAEALTENSMRKQFPGEWEAIYEGLRARQAAGEDITKTIVLPVRLNKRQREARRRAITREAQKEVALLLTELVEGKKTRSEVLMSFINFVDEALATTRR